MKVKFPSLKREGSTHRLLQIAYSVLFTATLFFVMWLITGNDKIESFMTTAQRVACCLGVSGLLGALMSILTNTVWGETSVSPDERPDWYYPVMSAVLSLFAMCVAYTFVGMWPLGNKTGMVVDMHHQYAPLLAGLRDNILSFDLSTYSFEVGLGANYISLFGYYLASPLNFLLVFFPERFLAEGILFITLLKNALCGGLFALCAQTLYRRKGLLLPAVSVMYSLMMYLLSYSWNIMWLDVVMALPLVILGFEQLMHNGRFLTYVLSLAYCLFANYYIGFMLCIFLVIYYIAWVLRESRTGKAFAVSFGRFAGFSVLAAGLTAVMLIPIYLALQETSAAGGKLPTLNNTIDLFDMLGRHLAGTSPTIRSGNLPNLYCGVLSAFCVPLFAMNKGIALRRRVTYMGIWLLLSVTFVINWSDLAWHGFHAPNDLPYRFSFVYSFFVLLMAFEALKHLRDITPKQVLSVFAGGALYLMLEEHFGDEAYGFAQIYINLGLLAVYALILLVGSKRLIARRVFSALLLLVVTAEMTINGGNALVQVNRNEYFTKHDDYVDNTVTELLHDTVDRMQEIGDKYANDDFYRMEFIPRRTCVDTALFQYRGITTFSSSNYYGTTKLMGGLGYAINGVNSHLYRSFVPFTDSLLGIKYVTLKSRVSSHPQLSYRETLSRGEESYSIHENNYALGLGYMVSEDVKEFSYTKYNPFHSQNDLFTALTGIKKDLYLENDLTPKAGDFSAGSHFQLYTDSGYVTETFSVTIQHPGQVFMYVDCNAAKSILIEADCFGGSPLSVTPYEPYIIDGGTMQAGDVVELTVSSEMSCSGNFYVMTMDSEVFERGMKVLQEDQLKVSSFSHTRIKGSVNASVSSVMMTSIPYDSGWSVWVDGKKVNTFAVSEGFLAFDLLAGSHTVEFSYSPKGFVIGGVITAVSLVVLLLLLFRKQLQAQFAPPPQKRSGKFIAKKKKSPAAQEPADTKAEPTASPEPSEESNEE